MSHIQSPILLQYLDALLKHGSFTKAAKDLYISQPYLTQTIKRTENDLGIEIVNRKSPQLQLTEAGKVYYRYLESIEESSEDLKRQLAKYSMTGKPTIRIAILPSLATYLLPLVLPVFKNKFPHISVTILEDVPKNNELLTIKEEVDFYIGQNPEAVSPSLITIDCGFQNYYAIIPPSSEFYCEGVQYLTENSISVEELLCQELVLTTNGSAIRRQIDRLLNRYKITPRIAFETSNVYTVAELAKQDLGVAFVPEGLVHATNSTAYNLYPITTTLISLEYFIAYPASKMLSENEKLFLDIFTTIVQKHTKKASS
ncbi:LysR family transcriptional regulator [Jeotgalibaca sp. A127]|uniref:LysR family transcriptional regulator n=1 Tax=Jeotgalibaca sp. A127 TaxID=3457324 RepID=UPI003FD274E7